MIIQGKPELGLQKHQQVAYQSIQRAYETKDKASIVMPTGCGKSFIALQLMVDNKDKRILFLAPSHAIKNQMYNYIAKYIVGEEPSSERTAKMIANEYFPNLKIMLYPTLLRVKDEQMDKIRPEIIIMDELHRTGADKWGERINTLLEKNPSAKILGLTATPDRMDDKNVIDDLFEGSIDYELTLVEALIDKIVKAPTYVKCDYTLGEYLEGIRTAIANCSDEQKKKELKDRYEKMRKIVDQADGIPELFAKNIKKKDGKYIIFCKDKAHMDELMSKAKEWFWAIDDNPEIYSVFSGEGYTKKDNRKSIEAFESSKSGHLKLLFSIEMLNEGLHVEDISGVIMARPTDSRIIYLQQLGRALSSDISREKTIVFDLVNNYLKNNLDAEINKRTNENHRGNNDIDGGHEDEQQDDIEDIDIFRIQGETKDFLELLNEAQGIINRSRSIYLTNAREIKEWIEKSGGTKPPSSTSNNKEEKRLGMALSNIRSLLIKPYRSLETEEEREDFRKRHPEIDEVMEIIAEIDKNSSPYLLNARKIKEWIEKSGGTRPSTAASKNEEERRLGKALQSIRSNLIKPYIGLKTEEEREDFRKRRPEIDEVMEIVAEIDKNNISPYLLNAREIKEWIENSGKTKPPSPTSNNKEEKKLGIALSNIRKQLIKPYMSLETEEEREAFRKIHPEIDEVMEIVEEIDKNNISPYLLNARAIKEWIEKSGGTRPPFSTSNNKEEKRLGMALSNIRSLLIKPYRSLETEEEREAFRKRRPEIDEVMEIVAEIDKNNIPPNLLNAREIKEWIENSGGTKPPTAASKNKEERRLGKALQSIRSNLIKPYIGLKTEEEREAFRERHPEIDEVMEIVAEIDKNNISPYLLNARAIKEWIEKSGGTKPPSTSSNNKEEKRLGKALQSIRRFLLKPYMSLETEEEREDFRKRHPEIDEVMEIVAEIDKNNIPPNLLNAREIKEWIEKSGGTKPPTSYSKNKEEKRLGLALIYIRSVLIKPYIALKTEEERKDFRKRHPEIDEVMEIVAEIDKNNISPYLLNARAIKEWIENSGGTKPPSRYSNNEEEKRLSSNLSRIRTWLKPYMSLETEEEKEKFRETYPEIDEVMEIVEEIDKNNISPYLLNARAIKEWIEKSGGTKPPSKYSNNKEEKRLFGALSNIRSRLIKPYMSLETEEEKEKFREKYPEIDEVLDIISELDMQCGTKKQQELAILIRQDLEKRKALQEAKKLEQDYEQQLSTEKGELAKDTQE